MADLDSELNRLVFECRNYSDYDAAALLHHMYSKQAAQNTAYRDLSMFLSSNVYTAVMAHCRDLSKRATDTTNQDARERYHEYASALLNFAKTLKNTKTKDAIIKEYMTVFAPQSL